MSLWAVAWLGWAAYFLIVEGLALFGSSPGSTLSEHVWTWFGTARGPGPAGRQPSGWTRLRRFVLLAFLAWLVAHFLTGGYF